MRVIDARGLACPAPVLRAKTALEQEGAGRIKVLVDNEAAQENVKRFLESKGFSVALDREEGGYTVFGEGGGGLQYPGRPPQKEDSEAQGKIMVMCGADRMGAGDDELGRALMINFIKTLDEMGAELWRLVFVNSGVKLSIEGSPVLAELQRYQQAGLSILVCGTCLNHFGLLDQKRVGVTTNMLDIVTSMQLADKIINIS
ncbi:MAG: sulfurtransferase-like selenium metabolism protein YedF [Desulfobacteraceae bacterium]